MSNDVSPGATLQASCSARAGGNKRIRRMVDYDISDGRSVEAVAEVSANPAMVAFIRKPGAHTITFNMRQRIGARPEIDWDYLIASGEVISLTLQITGGQRFSYPEVMVANKSPTGDSDGMHTFKLELIALEVKPM